MLQAKTYSVAYLRRRLAQARRELADANDHVAKHREIGDAHALSCVPAWEAEARRHERVIAAIEIALASPEVS